MTVRTVQGRLFGDASLRGALLTRSAMADGADTVLNVVSVASLLLVVPTRWRYPASLAGLVAGSAASFTIGLALGFVLATVGAIRDATLGSWIAFLVGGLLITGTGIVVLLGMLHVLDLMDTPRSPRRRSAAATTG